MSSDGSGDVIQKSLSELSQLRHEASKVFMTASEGVRDVPGEDTGRAGQKKATCTTPKFKTKSKPL